MNGLSAEEREITLRTMLDEMRRQLAIDVNCLSRQRQEELRRRALEYLNESWAFDEDERLRYASWFALPNSERREGDFSLSRRSVLGRWLNRRLKQTLRREPTDKEYTDFVTAVAHALDQFGLTIQQQETRGNRKFSGITLRASALVWRLGDGIPAIDPLRRFQVRDEAYEDVERRPNEFFSESYQNALDSVRNVQGATHTAQITDPGVRKQRENQFKMGLFPVCSVHRQWNSALIYKI